MFTGIIEEKGHIINISRGRSSASVRIGCKKVLEGTKVGDSICVNGICLTATDISKDSFLADVMEETINRTALKEIENGSAVNLERALKLSDRLGGHIVSGHIDTTGIIESIKKEEMAVLYEIRTENKLLRYIVEKGSIAIDGISLTVAGVGRETFLVSVIPHTMENTTLVDRRKGDIVNLETDIIGKYVEKLLNTDEGGDHSSPLSNFEDGVKFLTENGFA